MASQTMSPGGALLRSSRMFSLPTGIPPPKTTGNISRSATATRPYPTMQAVTTPKSSRMRGDWGFKRSFPLKSTTKSSTPLIRIKEVDTLEEVTDFASASDHTLTLEKFQELNIPMIAPLPAGVSRLSGGTTSVFNEEGDVTAVAPEDRARLNVKRWKFNGPWLAGMAEGGFSKYLKDTVRPQRATFRHWIKQHIAKEQNETATAAAQQDGTPVPPPVTEADVDEAQILEFLRQKRYDRGDLYKLVGEFLDLAPLKPPSISYRVNAVIRQQAPSNPYAATGPPPSHPSAGLSYLRTDSYIQNHPLYGPQSGRALVPARWLLGPSGHKKLGVAGFVSDEPVGGNQAFNRKGTQESTRMFDPSVIGGRKVFVEAEAATVDSNGYINILTSWGKEETRKVSRELVGEEEVDSDNSNHAARFEAPIYHRSFQSHPAPEKTIVSDARAYGL